jgi:hypothetical protein
MYRMTYNNKGINGCSARGIAIRDTVQELLDLAEVLKETICNIEIKPIDMDNNRPMQLNDNMKEE